MLSHGAKHTSDPERNLPQFEGLESRVLLTTLNAGVLPSMPDVFIYRDSNGHLVRVELASRDVTGQGRQTGVGQVELMKWVGAAPAGNVFDMPGRLNGVSVVPDMFGEGITGGWLDGADWNTGLSAVTAMGSFSTTQVWAYDRVTKGMYVINPLAHTVVAANMSLLPNQNVYSMAAVPPLLGVRTAMLFIWGTHKYTYLPPGATQSTETTITGMFRYDVVGNTATHIPVVVPDPDPTKPPLIKPAAETQGTPLPILTWQSGQSTLYGSDGTSLFTVNGMMGGLSNAMPLNNYSTGTALTNVTGLSMHGNLLYIAADGDKIFTYPQLRADGTGPYAKWLSTTGRTHGPGGGPGAVSGLFSTGTAPDTLYDFVRDGDQTLMRTVNAHPTPNADIFSIYINQSDAYTVLTVTPLSENWNHRDNGLDYTAPLPLDILWYDTPTFPAAPDFQRPLTAAVSYDGDAHAVNLWAPAGSGALLIGGVPYTATYANPDQNIAVQIVDAYGVAGPLGVFPRGSVYAGINMADPMPPDAGANPMDMGRILVTGTVAGRVGVTGSLDVLEAGYVWGNVRIGYDVNNIIVRTDYSVAPVPNRMNPIHEYVDPVLGPMSVSQSLVNVGGMAREINVFGTMYGTVNVAGSLYLEARGAGQVDYNAEPIWEMEHKPIVDPNDPFHNDNWPLAERRHWTMHGELMTFNNDLIANPATPDAAYANAQWLYNSSGNMIVWGTLGCYGAGFDLMGDAFATPIRVVPDDRSDVYALSMMAGQTVTFDAYFVSLYGYPYHIDDRRLGESFLTSGMGHLEVHDAAGNYLGSVGFETVEDYRGGNRLGNGVVQEPLAFTAPQAGVYYAVVVPHTRFWFPYTLFIDNGTPASLGALRVKVDLSPSYGGSGAKNEYDVAVLNGNLGAVEVTGNSPGTRTMVVGKHDLVSFRAAEIGHEGPVNSNEIVSDSNIGLVQSRTSLLNATIVAGATDGQYNNNAYIQGVFSAGYLRSSTIYISPTGVLWGLWASGGIGVVETAGTVWGSVYITIDGDSVIANHDSGPGARLDMLHVGGDWGGMPPIGVPEFSHGADSDIGMVKIDGIIYTWYGEYMGDLEPVTSTAGGSSTVEDDGGAQLKITPGVQVDALGNPLAVPDPNDPTKSYTPPSTYSYFVIPVEGKTGGVLANVVINGPVSFTNLTGGNVFDIGNLDVTGFGGVSIGGVGAVNVYYVHGVNVNGFSNTTGGALVSADFTTTLANLAVKGNVGHIIGTSKEWIPGPTAAPAASWAGWYANRINGVSVTGDLVQASIGGWLGDLLVSGRAGTVTVDSDKITPGQGFDGVVGVVHATDIGLIDVGDGLVDDGSGMQAQAAIMADHNIGTVRISGAGHVLNGAVLAVGDGAGLRGMPEPLPAIANVIGTNGAIDTALIASGPLDNFHAWRSGLVMSGWIGNVSFTGPGAQITGSEIFAAYIGKIETAGGSNGIDHGFFSAMRVGANMAGIGAVWADGPGISYSNITSNGGRIGVVRASGPLADVMNCQLDSTDDLDELSGRDVAMNDLYIPGAIGKLASRRDMLMNTSGLPAGTLGAIITLDVGRDFSGNLFTIASVLQSAKVGGNFSHSVLNLHGPQGTRLGLLDVVGNISGVITVAGSIGTIRSRTGLISAAIETQENPTSADVTEISALNGYTGSLIVAGSLRKFTSYANLGADPSTLANYLPKRIDVAGSLGYLGVRTNTSVKNAPLPNMYTSLYVGGNVDAIDIDGSLFGDVKIDGFLGSLTVDGDVGGTFNLPAPVVVGNVLVYGSINKVLLAPGGSLVGNLTGGSIGTVNLSDKSGLPAKGNIVGAVTARNGPIGAITVAGGSVLGNVEAGGKIGKVIVSGTKGSGKVPGERVSVTGDIVALGGGIDLLTVTDGDLLGNVNAAGGDLLALTVTNGSTQAGKTIAAGGSILSLTVKNGTMAANVDAGVRLDKLDLTGVAKAPVALTGNITVGTDANLLKIAGNVVGTTLWAGGMLNSLAITGSLTNASVGSLGDMGKLSVSGDVGNSQIIGGYKAPVGLNPRLLHSSNLKSLSAGSWHGSLVALGVDPVDGIFGNGDDLAAAGISSLAKMTLKTSPAVGGQVVTDSNPGATLPASMMYTHVDTLPPPLDPGGFLFDAKTKTEALDGVLIKLTGPGNGSYTVGTGQIVLLGATSATKLDVSKIGVDKPIHVLVGDDVNVGGLSFKGSAVLGNLQIDGAISTLSAEKVADAAAWTLPGGIVKTLATSGDVTNAVLSFGPLAGWTLSGALTGGSLTADSIGDLRIVGNAKATPATVGNLNTPITTTLGAIRNLVVTGDVGQERPQVSIPITARSGLASLSVGNFVGDVLVEKGNLGKFAASSNVLGNIEAPLGSIGSVAITNGSFGSLEADKAIRSLTGIGSYSLTGPKVALNPPYSSGIISTDGGIGSITVTNATMRNRVRAAAGISTVTVDNLLEALLASGVDIGKVVVKGDMLRSDILAGFDPSDAGLHIAAMHDDVMNVRIDGREIPVNWLNFDTDLTNDGPNTDRITSGNVVDVAIRGNMYASSIVTGAGPGMDGWYGGGSDDQVRGVGYVKKVVITGFLSGDNDPTAHYGILAAIGMPNVKYDPASRFGNLTIGTLASWAGSPRVADVRMIENGVTIMFTNDIDFSTITTQMHDTSRPTSFHLVVSQNSLFGDLDDTDVTDTILNTITYNDATDAMTLYLDDGSWATLNRVQNVGTNFLVTLDGAAVMDRHGNKLDGEFTGNFPSGDSVPGGDFRYRLAYGDIGDGAAPAPLPPLVPTNVTDLTIGDPILWPNQILTINQEMGDNNVRDPGADPKQDVDWFSVTMQPGDILYAWSPSNVLVTVTDDSGIMLFVYSLSGYGYKYDAAPGDPTETLCVAVSYIGYLGPYALNVLKFNDFNSNFNADDLTQLVPGSVEATPLVWVGNTAQPDESVQSIIAPDDIDLFSLGALAANTKLDLALDTALIGSRMDAKVAIFNSTGDLVGNIVFGAEPVPTPGTRPNDFKINVSVTLRASIQLPATDTYYVAVEGLDPTSFAQPNPNRDLGMYQLVVTKTEGLPAPTFQKQLVYLDFNGGDALFLKSDFGDKVNTRMVALSATTFGFAASQTQAMITAALDTVKVIYAGYSNIAFTTVQPMGGSYSTLYITNEEGPFVGLWGIAQNLDTFNGDLTDNVAVFGGEIANYYSALGGYTVEEIGDILGNVAGHELGHILGLQHCQEVFGPPYEVMGYGNDTEVITFGTHSPLFPREFLIGYENSQAQLACIA